jgi:hypothetical protein
MTRDDREKVAATGETLRQTFAPPSDENFKDLLDKLDLSLAELVVKFSQP